MPNETTPSSEQVSELAARVFALVRACPAGRVTTYGDLALALGWPRHARLVGYALARCPDDIPAHRTFNLGFPFLCHEEGYGATRIGRSARVPGTRRWVCSSRWKTSAPAFHALCPTLRAATSGSRRI